MIAALYVATHGPYHGRTGIDSWTIDRDARAYNGPWPVVAHPPCQRWGRYAGANGATPGEDGGCFQAALNAVLRYGGVLEHPASSNAWPAFGLTRPGPTSWSPVPIEARWTAWTCQVEQGHYGHRARKATWLFAVLPVQPPELIWGPSRASIHPRPGRDPERERRTGAVQRMCRAERERTPVPFAGLLIGLAQLARTGVF